MKYFWGLFFVLFLILPAQTLAEDADSSSNSSVILESDLSSGDSTVSASEKEKMEVSLGLYGLMVGGGPGMFGAGLEWYFSTIGMVYESPRPQNYVGPWVPINEIWWAIRTHGFYDFDKRSVGFFIQPNVQYLYDCILFSAVIGPEIGYFTKTGFDYGGSVRLGIFGLFATEFGYLVNSEKLYVNFLFNLQGVPWMEMLYHGP